MQIGFIGLGTMGAHMAANAQAGGYALIVNDLNQAAAAPHIKNGARWAANAREIGLAVLATTLSLIAIFAPIGFMTGIVGRFMSSAGTGCGRRPTTRHGCGRTARRTAAPCGSRPRRAGTR